MDSLDGEKLWDAHITVREGQEVLGGSIICEVQETHAIVHKCMVPPDMEGTIISAVTDGKYTIHDTIAVLQLEDGTEVNLTMVQKWPIRVPRPVHKLSLIHI